MRRGRDSRRRARIRELAARVLDAHAPESRRSAAHVLDAHAQESRRSAARMLDAHA